MIRAMKKLLTTSVLSILLVSLAGGVYGQSIRSADSVLQNVRGSDFSVLVEEERDSVLFVFHQQNLLIHSDHSMYSWTRQTHEGSEYLGYVLDYNINGSSYESLLRDQANQRKLTSRDISYLGTENYQAVFITNRNMVLEVRNKVRRRESFSMAVLSETAWHGQVYDMLLNESNLLNLASDNSFTLCSLLSDISYFERRENSLKGFETESISDLLKERGLSCTTDFELVQASPPPPLNNYTNAETNESVLLQAASGTAFAVSYEGHIITNNHVIEGCENVRLHRNGTVVDAVVVSRDPLNDLAVIQADFTPSTVFPIDNSNPQLMQDIYVAGYPFGENISSSLKVTRGIVSSLTGLGDNFSNMQIDAAIQPGNSGGPIFDEGGNVIGVAVATLDVAVALEEFGTIPQNTNFGVKANVVSNFLVSNGVEPVESNTTPMSTSELGQLATDATYYLSCWMTTAQIQQMSSTKVMFQDLGQ